MLCVTTPTCPCARGESAVQLYVKPVYSFPAPSEAVSGAVAMKVATGLCSVLLISKEAFIEVK